MIAQSFLIPKQNIHRCVTIFFFLSKVFFVCFLNTWLDQDFCCFCFEQKLKNAGFLGGWELGKNHFFFNLRRRKVSLFLEGVKENCLKFKIQFPSYANKIKSELL